MHASSLLGTLLATALVLGAGIAHADEGSVGVAPEEAEAEAEEASEAASAAPEPARLPAPVRASAAPGTDLGAAKVVDHDDGPLGPVRLGALAGTGAPSLLSAELVFTYKRWIGLAADFGTMPSTTLPIGSPVKVSQTHLSAALRVYPFRGAFFLGAAVGSQQFTASAVEHAQGKVGDVAMTSRSVFVMPQVGFLYRFSFGLAIGSDVGVELPLVASSSIDAAAGGSTVEAPASVQSLARLARRSPIPVLNLLRVGFVL